MTGRAGWRADQRVDALLAMLADEGGPGGAGTVDPRYLEAVRDAPVGRASEVAEAHAEGRGPPDFAASNRADGGNS